VVEHQKPGEEVNESSALYPRVLIEPQVDVEVIRDAFRKAEGTGNSFMKEKLAAVTRGETSVAQLMHTSPSSLPDFVSDDEWQDIEENNEEDTSRRRFPLHSRSKNSQLASMKEVQRTPKRRRNSFRHDIFSKDIRLSRPTSESTDDGLASAPKIVQSHSESSVRGRVGAVIADESTRRQRSPTRSIRWDNVPEGHDHSAPTPRHGRTPVHSPRHSPPLSRTTTPEPDGPRVQFELPSASTRP
jgi:hypothetical protein